MVNTEERQSIRRTYGDLNETATKAHRLQVRINQLTEAISTLRRELVEVEKELHEGLIKARPTVMGPQKPVHAKESKTEGLIRNALKDPNKVQEIMKLLSNK